MQQNFDLSSIKTIAIVMMENRSFDHMLGHLSLPPFGTRTDVEGLSTAFWPTYANPRGDDGAPCFPFAVHADRPLSHDLPHERPFVAEQIAGGTMNGFARAFFDFAKMPPCADPPSLGFFTPDCIPMTAFLAEQFTVCDHWFSPIPTSTLPNRLMAFSGDSPADATGAVFPDAGPLVLDWLTQKKVSWRVYHDGLFSFFSIFLREDVLGPNFRRFNTLAADVAADDLPTVIFIEPTYHDAPHVGHANDNHAPLQIGAGEIFLRGVYDTLAASPAWDSMVTIFVSDEHGGFFDHVPPLAIPYPPPAGAKYTDPFTTTGPRVPAIVASPLLARRSYNGNLDHTSILQLLAERFDPSGAGYSPSVNNRRALGIASLSDLFMTDAAAEKSPRAVSRPKSPAFTASIETTLGELVTNPLRNAFIEAGRHYMTKYTDAARAQLPELWHLLP